MVSLLMVVLYPVSDSVQHAYRYIFPLPKLTHRLLLKQEKNWFVCPYVSQSSCKKKFYLMITVFSIVLVISFVCSTSVIGKL